MPALTRSAATSPRPARKTSLPMPSGSARLELLVDPLAVRADRRPGLGRPRHGGPLAAERDHVRARHGTLGDLVLLHVMEVLRSIAIGPVVDAFIGLGAFACLAPLC